MNEIRNILNNATMAHSNMNLNTDTKGIVKSIFKLLNEDINGLLKVNQIDVSNNNGFELNIDILKSLEKEMINTEDSYRKVISMQKDEKYNYINGIQTDKLGTICFVFDGNTYNLIEMIVKCILTHNALIAVSENDYMRGTNELITILVKRILEAYEVDRNLFQILNTGKIDVILENNASINKVIVVGDSEIQQRVRRNSKIETAYKGFGEFDLYIEDSTHLDLIKEILQQDVKMNIYIKEDSGVTFDDAFYVGDIDEAIGKINFDTSGNSSSIFTDNSVNATRFLREVKTENVCVNASPIIETYADLDINLLLTNKKMYYPNPLVEGNINNKFEFPTEKAILEKKKNKEVQKKIEELKNENNSLKANNQKIQSNNNQKLEEKEKEIAELKKQLNESNDLANKYINLLQKSTFSRLFAKIKKEDIEKDMKMLS